MSGESILFVCTGNTCRSVMAEAFARREFADSWTIASAGLHPQGPEDAANAIETLKSEFRIDASGHRPCDVRSLDLESFSLVVAMDKAIAKSLRQLTSRTDIIVWNIDDPWSDDDLVGYKRCALKIKQQVRSLLPQAT